MSRSPPLGGPDATRSPVSDGHGTQGRAALGSAEDSVRVLVTAKPWTFEGVVHCSSATGRPLESVAGFRGNRSCTYRADYRQRIRRTGSRRENSRRTRPPAGRWPPDARGPLASRPRLLTAESGTRSRRSRRRGCPCRSRGVRRGRHRHRETGSLRVLTRPELLLREIPMIDCSSPFLSYHETSIQSRLR